MDEQPRTSRRRWVWLALFALVANPITLVGACIASFGVADAGNSLLQPEYTVLYEK